MTILLPEDYRESIGFTEDLKEWKHVLVDAVAPRGLSSPCLYAYPWFTTRAFAAR
jgi:hypothetical protein